MDTLKNIESVVQNNVDNALSNPYMMAIIKVALVLYASQIAPKLPLQVSSIFQNTLFKIIIISLIAYLANIDFQLSIIIAIVYVLGINGLSGRGIFESYENSIQSETPGTFQTDISKLTDLLGNPNPPPFGKLIESHSDNYPGCDKITMKDLLEVFDGNSDKLQNALMYSYKNIMQNLPDSLSSKDKLVKMAHAIGIPYNVTFTDRDAPLLATFLINVGYVINDSCQAPK
jgi:hypothetical protein